MKQKVLLLLTMMLMVWNAWAATVRTTLVENVELSDSWKTYFTFDADTKASLKAGDAVLVTVSSMHKENNTYPGLTLYAGSTKVSSTAEFYRESNFPCTIAMYLSESDIATIKNESTLKINGSRVALTNAILEQSCSGLLWEGTTPTFSWGTYCIASSSLISSVGVGDVFTVTVSATAESGNNLAFRSSSELSERRNTTYNFVALQTYDNSTIKASEDNKFTYTVTEDDLEVLKEKNSLYLSGNGVTVSKVEYTKYPYKTINVPIRLWSGTQVVTDGWSGHQTVTGTMLNDAVAGDEIAVKVTARSATDADPKVDFRKGSWSGSFGDLVPLKDETLPYTATLTLTDEILTEIRSNNMHVTGHGFTFTNIDLIRHITVDTRLEKGGAVTNLWSNSEGVYISWTSGSNHSETVDKSKFADATAGMKLRMSVKNVPMGGGTGRILHNWTAFTDLENASLKPRVMGSYYEYSLTDDMITGLQADGLRVSGNNYYLTSVDLIDPTKEYTLVSSYDTDDIKAWESDETPNLTVSLTNCEAVDAKAKLELIVYTDMFEYYNTFTSDEITIASGETEDITVNMTLDPGFYRMVANVNGNFLLNYYIGYNPTAIVSPDDAQSDFWEFWDTWKAHLAEIPIDAELTLLEGQEGDVRNIYEVKYKSVPETVGGEPVYIYGYYAEPKTGGPYPCIIHFHGTDKSGVLKKPSATEAGWCEFRFSARGQTLDKAKNGSEKYRTDPTNENSVDFYAYRLGDNDEHYYRYVYLDTRRAVDFVYSQAKVNKSQVFAVGGSQGGCLTYVCAALSDGKIRAIAPSITGHADFVHTMEIVTWPTNVFNNWINEQVTAGTYATYEEGKAALLAHQSYFDTKNFSSRIYCPVITNFSLQDNTDGPHLNISPYNLLVHVDASDKRYIINSFLGHGTFGGWEAEYMAFFQNYIDAATPLTIPNPVTVTSATYGTYYNSTATQLPTGVKAATIDGANNGTLTINWRYDGDDNDKNVIPGGTAVMLKSAAGNYTLTLLPDNTTAAPAGNLLKGSDVATTTTGGDIFYKLTYGEVGSENENNLGWYYGATGGAAFTIDAHKAWLALTTAQAGSAPSHFLLEEEEAITTDLVNLSEGKDAMKFFDSGQLFILREGVMYDVMGRVIK